MSKIKSSKVDYLIGSPLNEPDAPLESLGSNTIDISKETELSKVKVGKNQEKELPLNSSNDNEKDKEDFQNQNKDKIDSGGDGVEENQ